MKKIYSLAMLAMMAIAAVSFTSCGSDDNNDSSESTTADDFSSCQIWYDVNFSDDFIKYYDVTFTFTDASGNQTFKAITTSGKKSVYAPDITSITGKTIVNIKIEPKDITSLKMDGSVNYDYTWSITGNYQSKSKSGNGLEETASEDIAGASGTGDGFAFLTNTKQINKTITYTIDKEYGIVLESEKEN